MKNKKLMFVFAMACIFGSCNNKPKENFVFFSFNWYNNTDSIVYRNVYELKKFPINTMDSIVIYNEGDFFCSYKETSVKKKGIYRICNKDLMLTHSFIDTTNSFKYCLIKDPFLNQHVLLIGPKNYNLKGTKYKLYHYAEHNGSHSGYDSYYLEGIGFICYYNFDRDDYILCDSTNIKSLDIKVITSQLVIDTTFFARYTEAKFYPNYYRLKTQYNKYPTQ